MTGSTAAQREPRLSDIDNDTWVLAEDTMLTYWPALGREVQRRLRVWTGTGPWTIAVVTEPDQGGDGPLSARPQQPRSKQ
ncbi:hypothetical protein LO763_19530 [Glycomyces sp. A-F 0318]|uniref:hypothetical protein n=1 Tax=Glycomyces amatae TaxID=2881355 RepID=UPI001E5245A1|nr:hypothetical protein [Glycomyces amatae]MCD0445803.1 hypothetical protein [Glycomyces amatae]